MQKSQQDTAKISEKLAAIKLKAKEQIQNISSEEKLENIRVDVLGRKSKLTEILRNIKDLSLEGKKQIGAEANNIRIELEKILSEKAIKLQEQKFSQIEKTEAIDVTAPGDRLVIGHTHPVSSMLYRVEDIFRNMGFNVEYSNEIDDDFHNFESVNIPKGHPARDSWDTFWTEDGQIAITHTSSMQNRILKTYEPPVRVIVPGRCFRNEATDARHEHTFHQVEGIYVDRGISLGDMLGTLKTFFTEFFEQNIEVKFTPDFFPFVEPGGMMSLTCILCSGKGCKVCKQTGWLEVLGCGMIHPKVLAMAGIDADAFTGFAWGFGLERLIMLKNNIEDIRHFSSGKLKFIRQF